MQKTICRNVQIAPRNDNGRKWDGVLRIEIECGAERSAVNPGLMGASGACLLVPSLPAGWQTGSDIGLVACLCCRAGGGRNCCPSGFSKGELSFWTAACVVSWESLHRTHFQYFVDCTYGSESNLKDFLKHSIITLILGQSVIFFLLPSPTITYVYKYHYAFATFRATVVYFSGNKNGNVW